MSDEKAHIGTLGAIPRATENLKVLILHDSGWGQQPVATCRKCGLRPGPKPPHSEPDLQVANVQEKVWEVMFQCNLPFSSAKNECMDFPRLWNLPTAHSAKVVGSFLRFLIFLSSDVTRLGECSRHCFDVSILFTSYLNMTYYSHFFLEDLIDLVSLFFEKRSKVYF